MRRLSVFVKTLDRAVLTVSKGGDDAEFFAAHYDAANLFLPPMEYEEALAFTWSLHIRYKFEQIGHPEDLALMAAAMAEFSSLALRQTSHGGETPVVRDQGAGRRTRSPSRRTAGLWPWTGWRSSAPRLPPRNGTPAWTSGNLDGIFQPRGIAVIGVSSDVTKYSLARDIAELLHELRR